MNGIKYHRLKKGISQRELSRLSGVCIPTIAAMEQMTIPHGIYGYNYLKVQAILDATLDDLIRDDHPDDEFSESVPLPSKTENPDNCITKYRNDKNLTFQTLAYRIGVTTKERARQICAKATPSQKHIIALSMYEGISVETFVDKYSSGKAANF